ncbi:hypothetical protein BH23CHL8_BH23CHL8_09980 [soil metagenome]
MTARERTGRRYGLVDYRGAPDAERVVVVMGSGAGAVEETVEVGHACGSLIAVEALPLPVHV